MSDPVLATVGAETLAGAPVPDYYALLEGELSFPGGVDSRGGLRRTVSLANPT